MAGCSSKIPPPHVSKWATGQTKTQNPPFGQLLVSRCDLSLYSCQEMGMFRIKGCTDIKKKEESLDHFWHKVRSIKAQTSAKTGDRSVWSTWTAARIQKHTGRERCCCRALTLLPEPPPSLHRAARGRAGWAKLHREVEQDDRFPAAPGELGDGPQQETQSAALSAAARTPERREGRRRHNDGRFLRQAPRQLSAVLSRQDNKQQEMTRIKSCSTTGCRHSARQHRSAAATAC